MNDDDLLSLSRVKDAISLCVHCCQDGATSVPYKRLLQWRESIRAAEAERDRLREALDAITSACAQAGRDATHNHGTVASSRRPADQRSAAYCEGILRVTGAVARLAKKHPV